MKNNHSFPMDLADSEEQLELLAQQYHERMKAEGKSLQEVMNISDSFLEEIYGVAYTHYNQGRYKEAISLFYFLISIAPKNARFVFGFACSLFQTKDYEGASIGFYMCYALNPTDALAAFYAADCLLKLNQPEEAQAFLDYCIEAARADLNKYSILIERCRLIKAAINNK